MPQFHNLIRKPEYSYDGISWGDSDYYTFRELMNVLGIEIHDFDGIDMNNSSLLWFNKDEWSSAIKRLKNYDNESQGFKDSVRPFFDRQAIIQAGIELDPLDDIPTLAEIIKYMKNVLNDAPKDDSMIHLAWW